MSHSTIFRLAFLSFALSMAACTDIDDVQRAVSEAESEVGAHQTIIDRSTSLTAAHVELDRHADAIDGDMQRIRNRLDDVDDTCDTDRRGVWATVYDLEAQVEVYLVEANRVTDLRALRTASDDYRADMESELATLSNRLDDLPCW